MTIAAAVAAPTVYVLTSIDFENYEGCSVLGVFTTEAAAYQRAAREVRDVMSVYGPKDEHHAAVEPYLAALDAGRDEASKEEREARSYLGDVTGVYLYVEPAVVDAEVAA